MTINTGVYIPGGFFEPGRIHVFVGNQLAAINKGAYEGVEGVKQRVVIVDNEDAKEELQKQLLNTENFTEMDTVVTQQGTPEQRLSLKARVLSDRIITAGEYNQQKEAGGYCLNKLYIETQSCGYTEGAFTVNAPKSSPLKKGLEVGTASGLLTSAACRLAGASGSTILKGGVAAAALGFGWGYISQSRKPDFEFKVVTTKDMAKTLDHTGLKCADIRILSYNSGDRSELHDITDPLDRQEARTTPTDRQALDESMASAIHERHPDGHPDYGIVQGYQGACGYIGTISATQGHTTRRSIDTRQDPRVEKEVRQSVARVQTVIWP